MDGYLVFGFAGCGVADDARERIAQVCADVGRHAGIELATYEAGSYEELGVAVHRGEVDVAWLPPIPFIALDRRHAVVPLVSSVREGAHRFDAVIVVHRQSTYRQVADLARARAAWVDPHSASGYVFPRLELAGAGVDLRRFESETFYHSHERVVSAVANDEADFGATHATIGRNGEVLRAAWTDLPAVGDSLRVLAQLGTLPADVIGARPSLSSSLRSRVTRAFVVVSRDPKNRLLMREAFGVDEFRQTVPRGYDVLRSEAERAFAQGIL